MNLRPLLLLIPIVLFHGITYGSTMEAENRLQKAVNEVLAAAEKSPSTSLLTENLSPVLQRYLSFDAMTRRAIGPGWRQFSKDQQKKATSLFASLIIRTYCKKLTPGEYPVIKFKPASEPAPGRVDVPTTLLYQGSQYEVTYRMEQSEDWRVTDVIIEGVSLIANYRAQLDSKFKEGGSTAVLDSLTQTVAQPK